MKFKISAVTLVVSLLLTGCSSTAQNAPDMIAEETPQETTAEKKPEGLIYYVTDHGTTDTAQLSSFIAEATEIGYT